MRVCHIISGDLWAGAEAMAVRLLGGLRRFPEVELEAVLLNEGKLSGEIRHLDIPLTVLCERASSFPALLKKVRMIIREGKPDVIHTHRYKENLLARVAATGPARPRLVTTQHGMPEIHRGGTPLRQRLIARANFLLMARCFDGVVAVSRDIREAFVSRYGFRPDLVRVIHNGIALPANLGRASDSGPVVIGSSGRFFPVKEYPFMVEIAQAVVALCSDVRFELSGDGTEREEIEARIHRHGLEGRFVLRGFVDDMDAFYRELDLFLNTSSHEGIPMSVLEAMAWGLPIVAPKVGGIREIVRDGVDGFLVDSRDPRSFAEPCLRLIRDPGLRDKMGAAARGRIAEAFTVDAMALGYLKAYRDILR